VILCRKIFDRERQRKGQLLGTVSELSRYPKQESQCS
jgi:hypothetical protein